MGDLGEVDWDGLEAQYRVAFEAAQRRVGAQEAAFDAVRARAVQFLTVSGAFTAFLGGLIITDVNSHLGWLSLVGLVLFGGSIAICVAILWPTQWRSWPEAVQVIERYIERNQGPASMAEMYWGLAHDMEDACSDNEPALQRRTRMLQGAGAVTVVLVVVWLLEFVMS